jgi:hypothetical protein
MSRRGFSIRLAIIAAIVAAWTLGLALAEELHPTLLEFAEEVSRADLVLRGRVIAILGQEPSDSEAQSQTLKVKVTKVYKGSYDRPTIVLKGVCWYQLGKFKLHDDLIIPIKPLLPSAKDPTPFGQPYVYSAYFIYRVCNGRLLSPTGMAADLEKHAQVDQIETLIERTVRLSHKKDAHKEEYVLGEVLFSDDFNDGSMAGWTALTGARFNPAKAKAFTPPLVFSAQTSDEFDEAWIGERLQWKDMYPITKRGTIGQIVRNRDTGNLEGMRDGSKIEIGVYDGRLRLRSNHLFQHVTLVAGDPNWADYQVDADIIDRRDEGVTEPELIAQPNYKKFGIFGRVNVPNLPRTSGEHTEIGVEFGTYANHPATAFNVGLDAFQIRLKTPDVAHPREGSTDMRMTKILDDQYYKIRPNVPVHLTAKFMGRRVEGWINGTKYVAGVIPGSNWPQFQHGRIALWVFETFAEFDNVKVTRLIKKSEAR